MEKGTYTCQGWGAIDLEEIQDEDTSPSEITRKIPMEVEGFEPPQEEVILIHRNSIHDGQNGIGPGCKTVGSKWIFKKKNDMDGIVHTYKARLIEKDYTQLYGVDYEETFSPVANIRPIRILISIMAFYDYEIWKMDVKTAFLNGYLDEDIYMAQPIGASTPKKVKRMQNVPYALGVGFIINSKAEPRVDCYCNARFETDIDDMKSLTRYVSF
uniref:Retrotransposon protein, putative, Ty1-copia subclass n=1 Tax=Tanacetum cinerariifolium TaxID=118510 RepID=A0A6L2MWU6_TANCI|nr:retrotransposon protein, putative, Ty1-copia subclass [Tanacetum cinerariifolium]